MRDVVSWDSVLFCPSFSISKAHTLPNNITLQANVMYSVALCTVCTYSYPHTLRGLGTYPRLAVPFSHRGLIKATVQLRTNLFSLLQLQMLHIPSSLTENTADIFLYTSLWLSYFLCYSLVPILYFTSDPAVFPFPSVSRGRVLFLLLLIVSLSLWISFFY